MLLQKSDTGQTRRSSFPRDLRSGDERNKLFIQFTQQIFNIQFELWQALFKNLTSQDTVGVADIDGHDLRVKLGPADEPVSQRNYRHKVVEGQSLVASCVSRGTGNQIAPIEKKIVEKMKS